MLIVQGEDRERISLTAVTETITSQVGAHAKDQNTFLPSSMFIPVLRNWNRRNRIILTQEEPEPYPCSRFQFRSGSGSFSSSCCKKKYQTKSTLTGHWLTHA
jgi:hypothetical protein